MANFSLYFAANNGREGMFMYLLAASIGVLGHTPLALRVVPAIVGTVTLVGIYFAARTMFGHRVGVLSAGILAITFWHVAISRVAYRAILLPLALCVLMACVFAALRTNDLRKRLFWSACAGVAFGVCFYTYTSGQFALPMLFIFALSLLIGLRRDLFARRSEEAVYRRRMSALVFGITAFIVLAPLLFWLTQHANLYFNRAGQVSILSPAINNGDLWGTLANNITKAIGMFAFQGDRIWRHNLSLRPVFDGFLGVAFFIGVAVCVWRWLRSWQSRYGSDILGVETNVAPQFLLVWLVVFLVPTILAEDTPHFLRGIGALPAACILAAVGLEAALAWASRRGFISSLTLFLRRVVSPPAFIATLVLAFSGVNTVTDYFNDYVNRPITGYWLESQNVALANAIKDARLPTSNVWIQDRLEQQQPSPPVSSSWHVYGGAQRRWRGRDLRCQRQPRAAQQVADARTAGHVNRRSGSRLDAVAHRAAIARNFVGSRRPLGPGRQRNPAPASVCGCHHERASEQRCRGARAFRARHLTHPINHSTTQYPISIFGYIALVCHTTHPARLCRICALGARRAGACAGRWHSRQRDFAHANVATGRCDRGRVYVGGAGWRTTRRRNSSGNLPAWGEHPLENA